PVAPPVINTVFISEYPKLFKVLQFAVSAMENYFGLVKMDIAIVLQLTSNDEGDFIAPVSID
ncbi:MAG: hypothetical protein K2G92_02545, partial [Duncaniella sp.]|nr:hypothetical protein [Duncaniella sp.]